MDNAQPPAKGKSCAGLLFAIGGRSWFWGRGTPSIAKKLEAPIQPPQESASREGTAKPRRISFAGFVCRWRLPRQANESPKARFFSIVESIQASARPRLEFAEAGKWKAVRIAAPGKYFLGFVRR